jgi:hypothetical protein
LGRRQWGLAYIILIIARKEGSRGLPILSSCGSSIISLIIAGKEDNIFALSGKACIRAGEISIQW